MRGGNGGTSFDLIVFDCDGTLVDSEYLNNKVIADLLAAEGLTRYDAAYCVEAFSGKGIEEVVRTVETEVLRKLPPSFVADYTRTVNIHMPALMKAVPGAREVLRHFHRRVKICVASNGERANVLQMVEVGGFAEFLPPACIFTKDMVANPKPAPDLFLLAATAMGAVPSRTLAVEDSVTGAAAASAAGMTVVGFTGTAHDGAAQAERLAAAGAHHVTGVFGDITAIHAAGV